MTKSKSLMIAVPPEWIDLPFFLELKEKGHDLVPLLMGPFDVVFGPNCHMMTEEMIKDTKLIPVALKAARKRRKEKKNEASNGS